MEMQDEMDPVDMVVMWVDGSTPEFIASETATLAAERRLGKTIIHSPARHRDNGELRYALRGLHHNMPWLRRIHLVTNGQLPDWLQVDGERLVHVTHAEIFPDPGMLPCFNSFAIESCTHRIPGLAETFLWMSDDSFVGRPASREDVFGRRGFGRYVFAGQIQEAPKSRYQAQLLANARLFEQVIGPRPRFNYGHAPQVRSKALMEAFCETFAAPLEATRRNRFRGAEDVNPLFLYAYYHMHHKVPGLLETLALDQPEETDFLVGTGADDPWYIQAIIGGTGRNWRYQLKKMAGHPPLYFNLNDDITEAEAAGMRAEMTAFLERVFPQPSPYEKA